MIVKTNKQLRHNRFVDVETSLANQFLRGATSALADTPHVDGPLLGIMPPLPIHNLVILPPPPILKKIGRCRR